MNIRLGRIEALSVLNLHSRLKLRQVQKVAPIDRQILNLFRTQYSLHCGLFRVHLHGRALHLNNLAFQSDFQLHIAGRGVADEYRQPYLSRAEASGGCPHFVVAGNQGPGVVRARGIRRKIYDVTRGYISDRDLGRVHHRSARIDNRADNAACTHGSLCEQGARKKHQQQG